MTDPGRPAQFKYVAPDGTVIATGPLDLLNRQLEAHRTAEGAIQAAALAANTRIQSRADALDRREAAITAREQKAAAAAMKAFCDGVAAISRRLDALEEAKEQQRLAEEIRQADEALKALQDEGDLEPKQSPNQRDAEEIEAQGGATEAETAIGKSDDQMTSGGSPSLPQRAPEPYRLVEPTGALPKSDGADLATFGRTFLCSRDRKAARRAIRSATRR
jgi:hypothetical protein